MIILHFSECSPPSLNGVVSSVRSLCQMLQHWGHEAALVTARYPGYGDTATTFRLPSIWFVRLMEFPFVRPWTPKLWKTVSLLEPNVLHLHHPSLAALVLARKARNRGIPVVATYHTLYHAYVHYVPLIPTDLKIRVASRWLRWFYRHCDAIIAPSEFAKRSLLKYGVTCPVHVIPTGVDVPDLTILDGLGKTLRRDAGIEEGDVIFLTVGRLAKEKNLDLLIDTFTHIHHNLKNSYLWIVGDGPERDRLESKVRESEARGFIRFWGPVEAKEVSRFYAAADLFVCTSTTETQGLVVSEARAAGTPIIVVDEGGASETVAHNEDGFVVSATQLALGRCMRYLAQNSAVRLHLRAGCLDRRGRYSPDATTQHVLSLYQSLVR